MGTSRGRGTAGSGRRRHRSPLEPPMAGQSRRSSNSAAGSDARASAGLRTAEVPASSRSGRRGIEHVETLPARHRKGCLTSTLEPPPDRRLGVPDDELLEVVQNHQSGLDRRWRARAAPSGPPGRAPRPVPSPPVAKRLSRVPWHVVRENERFCVTFIRIRINAFVFGSPPHRAEPQQ